MFHVCMCIASSKQRARLRHAISEDRTKLKKLQQQYNVMVRLLPSADEDILNEEELLNGQFPWSQLAGITKYVQEYIKML